MEIERNHHTLDDLQDLVVQLKLFVARSLFEWSHVLDFVTFIL